MHESLAHKIPEDLLPANVQITSNTIILLCTSPRHQTARTYHELSTAYERPTPTTFKQQLEALPTQLWKLLGEITIPENRGLSMATAAANGELMGVSDTSVNDTQGSHVWTLTTVVADNLAIHGAGLVDGQISYLNSYQAELQSQLALFIVATILTRVFQISEPMLTSQCVNKGVLKTPKAKQTYNQTHITQSGGKRLTLWISKMESNA